MAVRSCRVVAIEGAHASGKTTLVHALVAHYRSRGVLVDCTGEPARTSPFVEDIVIHGRGDFDLVCEVDLFGAQLTQQLRAARHQDLVVCDKTVMNVLAYSRLVLDRDDPRVVAVLDAMAAFCAAWAPIYDLIIYCADTYQQPNDLLRSKVIHLQDDVASAVLDACRGAGCTVAEMPRGFTLPERVAWSADRIDQVPARGGTAR